MQRVLWYVHQWCGRFFMAMAHWKKPLTPICAGFPDWENYSRPLLWRRQLISASSPSGCSKHTSRTIGSVSWSLDSACMALIWMPRWCIAVGVKPLFNGFLWRSKCSCLGRLTGVWGCIIRNKVSGIPGNASPADQADRRQRITVYKAQMEMWH